MAGIVATKVGMTQIIDENGSMIPVTVLKAEANVIRSIKTEEKHGYNAIVIGYKRNSRKKANPFYKTKEFRISNDSEFKAGDEVTTQILEGIENVKLTSTSKGKGFAGVIKRHNFSRGPETHGSHHHRAPGSIGGCAAPGRVLRGKKMAGHMGNQKVTVRQAKVVYLNHEQNLIGIKGSVPGAKNNIVELAI